MFCAIFVLSVSIIISLALVCVILCFSVTLSPYYIVCMFCLFCVSILCVCFSLVVCFSVSLSLFAVFCLYFILY